MQKNISRLFAGVMVIVLLSFFTIPASAADSGLVGTVQSFVEWSVNKQNDFANSFWKAIFGDSFNAEDFTPGGKYGGGGGRDELQAAYDAYVSDLPASGYASDGSLLFIPSEHYVVFGNAYRQTSACSHLPENSSVTVSDPFCSYVFFCDTLSCRLWPLSGKSCFWFASSICYFPFCAPVSGYYSVVSKSETAFDVVPYSSYIDDFIGRTAGSAFNDTYYDSGTDLMYQVSIGRKSSGAQMEIVSAEFQFTRPVIKVVPLESSFGGGIYNINTRPTSITGGNYGIVGDNGQITKVEGNTIVNETNNTVWNPVTGSTSNITDWSYDYSTRTYTVTLENGTTQTITYGNENITIKEGDTVYNVYYLVDGGSTEENPSCDHVWMETDRTEPTCTIAGQVSSTCSKCGQSKTDPIPALGHDWQVKQTVTTEYDDTGQLVQEGYTIFECSRCQEQYKSTDGTTPPDKPPDSGEEDGEKKGFFAWLWDVLTDSLKKLIEGIIDAILKTLGFFFGGDGQSNADFYNNPSTFSGVSVWD